TSINGGANIITALGTIIKDSAFGHKQWRVREQILQWVVTCTKKITDFSLRPWVPYMVKLLEDPHEHVRETAKDTIISLFSGAASHAKSDLKRELQEQSIRLGIVDYILTKVYSNQTATNEEHHDNHTDAGTELDEDDYVNGEGNDDNPKSADSFARPNSSTGSEIGVLYVDSAKELEREFQNILTPFQGKESEQNWLIRERNINRLRGLVRGEAYVNFKETFINGLKLTMDGILKSLNSLRTTLTLASAGLIKDLAVHLGPAIDPFADNILANLIKMVLSTKKIVARAASVSANALLQHVSYHNRLVTQLWNAMDDNNKQLREYAIGFVKTVIKSHENKKDVMERSGAAEMLEKCVRKGLTDANPKVRETCREVFWAFYEIWIERGERILKNIEPAVKKQLERDKPKTINLTSPVQPPTPTTSSRGRTRSTRPPSIATSDSGMSDNYPVRVESASKEDHSRLSAKTPTPKLRAKSPAPHKMTRSKSDASKSLKSPLLLPNKSTSPNATTVPKPQPRKLTVIEQLEHSEWTTRIEGILSVAQLVVKRTLEPPSGKPGAHDFKKALLPPDDDLSPHLVNILNDSNNKVLETFLEPNVFVEVAKVVKLEILLPKVLLLASDETRPEQAAIVQNFLPRIKSELGSEKSLVALNKCLLILGGSGTAPRKLAAVFGFTPPQKRKVINGILNWFNEIIEPKVDEADQNDGKVKGFLGDQEKYKLLANRLIPMVTMTKEKSENFKPLSDLLINLHKINADIFEEVLYTFDNKAIDAIGEIIGWEDELKEAESEVLEEERQKILEEQERQREKEEKQLQEIEYEKELQRQHEIEIEKQRERELALQRKLEQELQLKIKREQERELQEQRERELQEQRERELQEQRERELQEQRERELQEQRERELQEQRELQDQRERELHEQERMLREREMEREREFQMKRERELQEKREYEIRMKRERELQEQLDYERERELMEQREYERTRKPSPLHRVQSLSLLQS
ncbi:13066_t:CDS:2, partial [Acaulospora morrowiae]